MSYAIGYVVYGTIWNEDVQEYYKQKDLDPEEHFEFAYSGNGPSPGWCGIVLDTIDECSDMLFSDIKATPSSEQKNQAETKAYSLPLEVQELLDPLDVYLVWGSS